MTPTAPFSTSPAGAAVLQIENLTIAFSGAEPPVVHGMHLELFAGRTLGLVGESGSGKSVTALAAIGIVRRGGRVVSGRVLFEGRDLLSISRRDLSRIRGRKIGMIFQEPRRSLDAGFTVGDQLAEVARRHLGLSRRAAHDRAIEMLDRVHIADARRRSRDYPHQFSGGMCQRVLLALALCADPTVLIADEPTTALDVTVQQHVLELIRELQRDMSLAVLFISHDLAVVSEMCDRVDVMYAGELVESATSDELFERPLHPYAEALIDSLPQVGAERLRTIPGAMPDLADRLRACPFAPRCAYAVERCRTEPPVLVERPIGVGNREVRCHRADELHLHGVEVDA